MALPATTFAQRARGRTEARQGDKREARQGDTSQSDARPGDAREQSESRQPSRVPPEGIRAGRGAQSAPQAQPEQPRPQVEPRRDFGPGRVTPQDSRPAVQSSRQNDAGAYAAQLTLSGQAAGGTTLVGGTVAGGEARLTRLNDYRLDMGPSEVMLITHHRDRPGMIGRIGQTLGEADVNISAMHVGRSAPRADALMILALDDDVSPAVADQIRAHDSVIDLWTIRLGSER
jgi:hypothetical protein